MSKTLFIYLTLLPFLTYSNSIGNKDSIQIPPEHSLLVGIRAQKAVGFYWSNGITAEYASSRIWKNSLAFGMYFVSSRLGTAASGNAIPCFEISSTIIKYFRMSKSLKTNLKLNAGYAQANYGSDNYDAIRDHSMTVALEAGLSYDFKFPMRLALAGGYNFITGNGVSGLSTVYPVYWQCSILYKLVNK